MLTELGHGLDAKNLETEVILQPEGSFVLNSPSSDAYKYDWPFLDKMSGNAYLAIQIRATFDACGGCTTHRFSHGETHRPGRRPWHQTCGSRFERWQTDVQRRDVSV